MSRITKQNNYPTLEQIDQLVQRGIIPGAKIKCATCPDDQGMVGPISKWKLTALDSIVVGTVLAIPEFSLHGYSGNQKRYATVISPPSAANQSNRSKQNFITVYGDGNAHISGKHPVLTTKGVPSYKYYYKVYKSGVAIVNGDESQTQGQSIGWIPLSTLSKFNTALLKLNQK